MIAATRESNATADDLSRKCLEKGLFESVSQPLSDPLLGDLESMIDTIDDNVKDIFDTSKIHDGDDGSIQYSLKDLLDDCSIQSMEVSNKDEFLEPEKITTGVTIPNSFGPRSFHEVTDDEFELSIPDCSIETGNTTITQPTAPTNTAPTNTAPTNFAPTNFAPTNTAKGSDSALQNFLRSNRKSMNSVSVATKSTTSLSSLDFSGLSLNRKVERNITAESSYDSQSQQNATWNISGMKEKNTNALLDVFSRNNSGRDQTVRQTSGSSLLMKPGSGRDRLVRVSSGQNLIRNRNHPSELLKRSTSHTMMKKQLSGYNPYTRESSHGSLKSILLEQGALSNRVPTRRAMPTMKHKYGQSKSANNLFVMSGKHQ